MGYITKTFSIWTKSTFVATVLLMILSVSVAPQLLRNGNDGVSLFCEFLALFVGVAAFVSFTLATIFYGIPLALIFWAFIFGNLVLFLALIVSCAGVYSFYVLLIDLFEM
jgi:hypothetical protein